MGRLGNQMFQYAALKGISKNRGYEFSIPNDNILKEYFNILDTPLNQNIRVIEIKNYHFDEHFFNNCPDNIDLRGYFQSEKYFRNVEDQLRKEFTFSSRIHNICSNYKNNIFSNQETISLHIRRTDYLTDPNFECLSLDYYYNALKLLPNLPVIIFSDDPIWCKDYFTSDRFTICTSNKDYIDLCLMSMCNYHIIANSSFSWWGSWLAQSKKTIAPKKWFCGKYSDWDTRDLYLPHWILL